MASNNFDQNIKSKLKNRTIKPSDSAWNRLSNKLDAQENQKSYKAYWRIGIAASIVGILFFTIRNFETNSVENNTPIIVDSQTNEKNDNQNSAEVKTPEIINPVIDKKVAIEESGKQQHIADVKKETIIQPKQNKASIKEESSNEALAVVENTLSLKTQEPNSVVPNTISFKEQKIQEVVTQIQELENKSEAFTEAEIDQLLAQAENQIKIKRLYSESTRTVDANSLLEEVEADLELSFRNKVLKALKSSYENVKVAVTERNE